MIEKIINILNKSNSSKFFIRLNHNNFELFDSKIHFKIACDVKKKHFGTVDKKDIIWILRETFPVKEVDFLGFNLIFTPENNDSKKIYGKCNIKFNPQRIDNQEKKELVCRVNKESLLKELKTSLFFAANKPEKHKIYYNIKDLYGYSNLKTIEYGNINFNDQYLKINLCNGIQVFENKIDTLFSKEDKFCINFTELNRYYLFLNNFNSNEVRIFKDSESLIFNAGDAKLNFSIKLSYKDNFKNKENYLIKLSNKTLNIKQKIKCKINLEDILNVLNSKNDFNENNEFLLFLFDKINKELALIYKDEIIGVVDFELIDEKNSFKNNDKLLSINSRVFYNSIKKINSSYIIICVDDTHNFLINDLKNKCIFFAGCLLTKDRFEKLKSKFKIEDINCNLI